MNPFTLSVQRFDEFATEYANRFGDIESYRTHFDAFTNLVQAAKPCILELGCGPGNVTRYLKETLSSAAITAIDLAPGMIDLARKAVADVDFKVMDVRDIKTLHTRFDAIMCSFCLPFLSKEDAAKLIDDCAEMLNHGGVLYLSTMEGDESKAGFEPTSFSGRAEVYFNYHRKADLEKALQENLLRIEHNKQQIYAEPDGTTLVDLILIACKS